MTRRRRALQATLIGAGLATAVLALDDTMGERCIVNTGLCSAYYPVFVDGWGLLASAILALTGLYFYLRD